MSTTARVGSAVAAGYLLGRFKKLRLALIVGSALANKDVRNSGMSLLQRGGSGLGSGGGLTKQVKSQLMDAGKAAAVSVAASKINRLSDRIQERSDSMRGVSSRDDEDDDDVRDEADDVDDEQDDLDDDEQDEDVDEPTDEDDTDEGDEFDEADEDDVDEEPEDEYDEESEPDEHQRRSPRRRRTAAPVGSGGA